MPSCRLAVFLLAALPLYRLTAQAYFQQDIRYTIRAALDEPSGVLAAAGQLVYKNNSPGSLHDLYFHLYLNAFRPGSLWSADERREGIHRFADLPEPYNAFEKLQRVRVAGADLAVDYPNAPDSTIAHVALPRPLASGDSIVVDLAWLARPSAIPRRQGRRGRRFDFAQWYPKVCVYDVGGWQAHPFHLAGELYGEYGSYDVTLDLADDQVVAATALPVAGDPGWARARATPETPVTLQADWYGSRLPAPSISVEGAAPGRKRVRFYAENIHHFAFSLNPQYRYEEGRFGDVVLRTFYLPEDSATWGGGRVIERTHRAMAWLDTIFGGYPYPQTVVLHRIEGGGTEFPMLVMNGGPEESLIFHEVGHIYTYGILGNNEWKEGWLDEGFTTFQTAWNFQRRGMGVPSQQTQQLILNMDLDGWSQPVSTVAENFSEFGIYNRMIYTKGQLVYEMLRYQLGEETFRRGLRLYYDRWKLKHVDEVAFRQAMEQASGQDLRLFFRQWLHQTPRVDYRIGGVDRERLDNGTWRTTIRVRRRGEGVMPVDVAVPAGDSVYIVRAAGVQREELVQVITRVKPGRVELDPARQTMDWNYLNNREGLSFLGLGGAGGRTEEHVGWSGSQPARRDRLVNNWMPLAWYSDAGGVTIGLQTRTNYMGRFSQNVEQLVWATRENFGDAINAYYAIRNPLFVHAPRMRWGLEGWMHLDGRSGFRLSGARDLSQHLTYGPRVTAGGDFSAMYINAKAYVNPGLWQQVNVYEFGGFFNSRWSGQGRSTDLRLGGTLGFGGTNTYQGITNFRTWTRAAVDLRHRRARSDPSNPGSRSTSPACGEVRGQQPVPAGK